MFRNYRLLRRLFILFFLTSGLTAFVIEENNENDIILTYIVDPQISDVAFFWKDDHDEIIKSLVNLRKYVESKNRTLVFAMNGGMYKGDRFPQGLYVEKQKTITPLDTTSGNGNFYLKPNGVFYITADKKGIVCKTADYKSSEHIEYATQSGPMLLVNGEIHPAFQRESKNLNIRNGVGILSDNKIVFAMSKAEINFYDFANHFKNLGCKNALYLDGFVSRTYWPEGNWMQTDGQFGVIIGVTQLENE